MSDPSTFNQGRVEKFGNMVAQPWPPRPPDYEAAIAAVRALHQPTTTAFDARRTKSFPPATRCTTCTLLWPCPTERAIREHLGETQ